MRWTGTMLIKRAGNYRFAISSDDGTRLFLQTTPRGKYKLTVANDGLHGWRAKEGTLTLKSRPMPIILEYFQKGGGNGVWLRYPGPHSLDKDSLNWSPYE